MKMRRFAALLLGIVMLMLQVVTAQATLEDEAPTLLDKFAPQLEETETPLPPPSTIPEDNGAVELDKFTLEEIGAEDAVIGGNQIHINDEVIYDREKRAFLHNSQRAEIYSNVASGMTTTEPVWLSIPEGIPFHLNKDGEHLEDVNYSNISEPGGYLLLSDEGSDSVEIMHFTIVAPVTGQISRFQVPEGFAISAALCNGSRIASERTYVDMVDEGEYDISYRCPATETLYMFRVTIDHTPPVLALAAVGEDGSAKGPVDISDVEEGASISIWLNGNEYPYEQVLTRSGKYRIVVTDAAGNMNTYAFMIRVYYTTSSIIFFATIIAVGVGVGIYGLHFRRHMRVR